MLFRVLQSAVLCQQAVLGRQQRRRNTLPTAPTHPLAIQALTLQRQLDGHRLYQILA